LSKGVKIGIITLHHAHNYGAVLQSYALMMFLRNNNCDAKIINYKNAFIKDVNENITPFCLQKGARKIIKSMLCYNIRINKYRIFDDFIKNELILNADTICNSSQIKGGYDLFITGSDQIWNSNCTKFDKTYFLDFVKEKRKKYSYAASFGFDEIPGEYIKEYKALLLDFDKISVRESQGAIIIKNLTGIDVPVVLDPTFLLTSMQWKKLARKASYTKKYIFMYLVNETPYIIEFAKKLSMEKGIEILFLSDSIFKQSGITYIRSVHPYEWLCLLKNAEYVVTNSFHGIAFSIIFQKELFIGFPPPSSKVISRLWNIINIFDLQARLISVENIDKIDNLLDYAKINEILEKERAKSIEYLKCIAQGRSE